MGCRFTLVTLNAFQPIEESQKLFKQFNSQNLMGQWMAT